MTFNLNEMGFCVKIIFYIGFSLKKNLQLTVRGMESRDKNSQNTINNIKNQFGKTHFFGDGKMDRQIIGPLYAGESKSNISKQNKNKYTKCLLPYKCLN